MRIEAYKLLLALCFCNTISAQSPIDRKKVVERHKVIVTKVDSLSSLTVGNGKFAFTVDVTGLQSFAKEYQKGIPFYFAKLLNDVFPD